MAATGETDNHGSGRYEEVLEVVEYYDGPRRGIALFEGRPHKFESRFTDAYSPSDDVLDVFELVPLDRADTTYPVLAHGEFQVAPDAPVEPPGTLRKLVVKWTRCNATDV
jgi:hypothetical protein